jgi:hypothetical protein
MKNIFRNILLGGLAVTMIASCDLNLVPTTSIVYEEGTPLFLSEGDIAEFQNGVLASYRGLHYGSAWQTVEVMTDCFNATVDFGNNYGFVHRLGSDLLASDEYTTGIWSGNYGAIKNYNIAIEQCELVTDEALLPSANVLKGMALFCRASSYLNLVRAFAADYDPATATTQLGVPLILKYDQLEKPVRATVQEVYDQIIADLDEAEVLLEEAAQNGPIVLNGNKAQGTLNLAGQPKAVAPTVDAVRALKARYYLDIEDYDSAAQNALDVIDSEAGYALSSSIEEMNNEFMADEGNESLIRLYASKSEGAVGCTLYTSVNSTDAEGKFFSPLFIPSQTLVNAYNNSDLRKQVWLPVDMYPVKVQGTLYNGIAMFTKYIGNPTLQTSENEDGAHYCKPLMLAEMYLIAAEAYAQAGNEGEAETILKELKTARRAGDMTGTIMEEVKLEWLRETVGDGQRINCIKRWGDGLPARPAQKAAENIVANTPVTDYTGRELAKDAHTLVWPIPSYEIKISPALVQNPGYSAE